MKRTSTIKRTGECSLQSEPEILRRFFDVYPKELSISPGAAKALYDLQDSESFREIVLNNPVGFRTFLTLFTPSEDLGLRSRLYKVSHPLEDYFKLAVGCGMAFEILNHPETALFARVLSLSLIDVWTIDEQKTRGRPGSIENLREGFRKIENLPDGSIRIEEDHWPWAKVVKLIDPTETRVDVHLYLSNEQITPRLNNYFDYFLISLMKAFSSPLRNRFYECEGQEMKFFCHMHSSDGRDLDHASFSLYLREKYQPLLQKQTRRYPGEREDLFQQAELAFFESILNYSKEKGPPPGYFSRSIQHELSESYRKFKKRTFFEAESFDQLTDADLPRIEIIQSGKSTTALVEEVVRDLLAKDHGDDENRIILENYGCNDREIAREIGRRTGRSITKQAVQKRRRKLEKQLLKSLKWKF